MTHLEDGYVIDVPYPTFVHRQAMPLWLTCLIQLKGFQAPNIQQPYRYLELGCAMGIHLHLAAAANPNGHFVGVDFNEAQLLVAQEGINKTNIPNLEFIHASFKSLLEQSLEPFDFIVTHGVWSWVSPENQQILLQLINCLLKPGGVVYCSYMSHPGADQFSSVQKLMFEMSRNLRGNSASKAVQSLNFVRQLGKCEQGVFNQFAGLNSKLEELSRDKPNYIAHDFLSEHWHPQHSADMIRNFGQHDIGFVTGAGIAEYLDAISLKPEVRRQMQQLPLVTLQETVRDMALNTLQRQDIYIRSRQQLTAEQWQKKLQTIMLGLLPNAPVGQDLRLDPKIGAITDVVPIAEKILKILIQGTLSIGDLFKQLQLRISIFQLSDIILLLMWAGYIHPVQSVLHPEAMQNTNEWMKEQNLAWRASALHGTALELV